MDAIGAKITGSVVYNLTRRWTYTQASETVCLEFDNEYGVAIEIVALSFRVSATAVALADLNSENLPLNTQMIAHGAASIIVAAGTTETGICLSAAVSGGSYVVVRYSVSSPSPDDADVQDWVQFQVPSAPHVSSLSEWGLAALVSVALIGLIVAGARSRFSWSKGA